MPERQPATLIQTADLELLVLINDGKLYSQYDALDATVACTCYYTPVELDATRWAWYYTELVQSSIFPNLICVTNHVDHESCDYHYYVSYEKT